MPTNAQARNDTVSGTEDRSINIDVLGNDDGTGLHIFSLDQTNGSHALNSSVSAMGAQISIQGQHVIYSASSDAIAALAAGQHATDTFTYTVQGNNGSLSTATVTINLTGVNDAPVTVGAVTASVNEDAGVSTINALANASDPDAGSTLSVVNVPSRLPTGVTFDAATNSFKLDPANAIFQSLGAGDTQTVSVSYQVSDGLLRTNDTATWTVHGVNDVPTITGLATGSVVEGSLFQQGAAGVLHISDPDAGESHFASSTLQLGNYGAFAFDAITGVWGYLVNSAKIQFLGAGDTVTDTLTVKSADGSASQNIVITINGVNDAASISGSHAGAVTEGSTSAHTATGTLTVSDVDQNQAKLAIPANLNGAYGSFAIDQATGVWTYTLDNAKAAPLKAGQTTTDTLTVKSVDGTASTQIVVTITGTDTAPTVTGAVKGDAAGSAPVRLDALGNASDSEGDHLSVVNIPSSLPPGVTYDAATHSFVLNPTDPAYTPLAQGETQTVSVAYGVSDGVSTTPATVSWTVTGSNDAPVVSGAVTGAATQGGVSTVDALGKASDVDHGSVLSVTGVPAALPPGVTYDPATHSFTLNSADPSYKSLAQGETQTVTVTYAVSDGVTTTPATVSWTVTGANDAPTVSAPLSGAAAQGAASAPVDALGGAADVDHGATLAVVNVPTTLPPGVAYDPATHSFSLNAADPSYQHLGAGQTEAVTVTFGVSDGIATTPQTITWTVTGANDAPVVSAALTGAAAQGAVSTVNALSGASDVDDGTTLSVVQPATLPAGVTYDATTHSYSLNAGDPSYAHLAAGATQTVTVNYGVTDGSATTPQSISWTVTGVNDAPTVAAPLNGAAAQGAHSTVDALSGAHDVDDGAVLSVIQPATLPTGVTYDAATHSYSLDAADPSFVHLAAGETQMVSVTYGVSDGTATTAQTITWTVTGANDAPTVSGTLAGSAAQGGVSTVDALSGASDVDDGTTLNVVQPATLPPGVTYDAATHSYSLNAGDPSYAHLADGATQVVTVNYGVTDGAATTPQSISWTVTGLNDAPVVAAPLTAAAADGAAPSTVNALAGSSDVDDGAVLSVVNVPTTLPPGVTYDAATHSFSLDGSNSAYDHLAAGDTQAVSVTFGVSDGEATTSQTITWTVTGANDAPVVAGPLAAAAADGAPPSAVNALAGASDVDDGSHLAVVVPTTLPPGVTYDAASHSFALDGSNSAYDHLAAGQTEAVTLTYGVTDGTATTAQTITWTVTGANDAPVVAGALSGAAAAGAPPSAVNALAGASDVDDNTSLSVVVPTTLPAGVTYDAATHSFVLDGSNSAYDHLPGGVTETVTVNYGVTDGLATTAQSISWTLVGANDPAHIGGVATGGVTEDGVPHATGALTIADADDGQAAFAAPNSLAGAYGAFTFDAGSGQWGYTLDDAKAQGLAGGETTTDVLHVSSLDGSATHDIVVTITGTNDVAVIGAPTAFDVVEDVTPVSSGMIGIQDADDGEAKFAVPASLQGQYGAFTFDAQGAWSYTLDNSKVQALAAGETTSDTLHVTSFDGSASQDIVVRIVGTNDPATISGETTGAVTEDAAGRMNASGQLVIADADHGEASFATPTNLSGANGVFTFDAATGQWGYALDAARVQGLAAGETTFDTLHVTSADGTASDDIVVTITGTNDVAILGGQSTGAVTEDSATLHTASGQLTISDADNFQSHFATPSSLVGTYGLFSFNADGAWGYTLDNSKVQQLGAGETTSDVLHVTSVDGSASQEIVVTVTGVNDAPVSSGAIAPLNTLVQQTINTVLPTPFSDVDHGDTLTYSVSGLPSFLHFDAATHTLTGTAPDHTGIGAYSMTLTATDSHGLTASQAFTLNVAQGPEVFTGTASADTITGSAFADTLSGGLGADVLNGGAGDDVINAEPSTGQTSPYLSSVALGYLNNPTNSLVNGLGTAVGAPSRATFGENVLPLSDDGFTPITQAQFDQVFPSGLNFFGTVYHSIFVDNNGAVSFGAGVASYTPEAYPTQSLGVPIISPFWADVDTRGAPAATAAAVLSQISAGGNSTGSDRVYYDLDTTNHVLTVTWDDVGQYAYNQHPISTTNPPNAFQLQIIDEGGGDFDVIFRYEAINWLTGDANSAGQYPQGGFDSGNGHDYYNMPGTRTQQMGNLESQSNTVPVHAGVFEFYVRGGGIGDADTLTGGLGADTLTGGGGLDVFRYASANEGGDVIVDFTHNLDKIAISASGFGHGLAANVAPTLLTVADHMTASQAATTGDFIYETGTGTLWWDADGGAATNAVKLATLGVGTIFTVSDFLVQA